MYIKTNGTMNMESAPDFYFHDAEAAIPFIKGLVKSGRHMFIDVSWIDNIKSLEYIIQELRDVVSENKICDFRFSISI